MTTAMIEATGHIDTTRLADGLLVRLGGPVTGHHLPALREALLMPLDEGCRDVVIDAGDLTEVDDEALAVLIAARVWAEEQGARMLLSRSAPCLEETLEELEITGALPRLGALHDVPVPAQRAPQD